MERLNLPNFETGYDSPAIDVPAEVVPDNMPWLGQVSAVDWVECDEVARLVRRINRRRCRAL